MLSRGLEQGTPEIGKIVTDPFLPLIPPFPPLPFPSHKHGGHSVPIASGKGIAAGGREKGVCLCLICSEGLSLREMERAQSTEKRFGKSILSRVKSSPNPGTSTRLWGKGQTGEAT